MKHILILVEGDSALKIRNALCVMCLSEADVFVNDQIFCKSCFEWLGWNRVPEIINEKTGCPRTMWDLSIHLATLKLAKEDARIKSQTN